MSPFSRSCPTSLGQRGGGASLLTGRAPGREPVDLWCPSSPRLPAARLHGGAVHGACETPPVTGDGRELRVTRQAVPMWMGALAPRGTSQLIATDTSHARAPRPGPVLCNRAPSRAARAGWGRRVHASVKCMEFLRRPPCPRLPAVPASVPGVAQGSAPDERLAGPVEAEPGCSALRAPWHLPQVSCWPHCQPGTPVSHEGCTASWLVDRSPVGEHGLNVLTATTHLPGVRPLEPAPRAGEGACPRTRGHASGSQLFPGP